MQCVGLIAMGIVNKKDYEVCETESGEVIYTPKEKLKENNLTDQLIDQNK